MNEITQKGIIYAWLTCLRLKTLLLALASVIAGLSLAFWDGHFNFITALLTLVTALLLQILSNLSNDYGDISKGTDDQHRIGPIRAIQKGLISLVDLKIAIILVVILTIIIGSILLILTCHSMREFIIFLGLGCLSIIAAITYTIGKKPYGYIGLGDLSVLVFFGWLTVIGSFYLQTGYINWVIIFPATMSGLLAVAVLNINNMRDLSNDKLHNKKTLAVRLGRAKARYYHLGLLVTAMLSLVIFNLLTVISWTGWLFMITIPLLYQLSMKVFFSTDSATLCPLLGKMVMITLLINLLFATGLILQ